MKLLVLALLTTVAACAPQWVSWYAPDGTGELSQSSCGYPPTTMKFRLDTAGSRLIVGMRQRDEVVSLYYVFFLDSDAEVRLRSNKILIDWGSDEASEYAIESFKGIHAAEPRGFVSTQNPLEPLRYQSKVIKKNDIYDEYLYENPIEPRSTRFTVRYPDMIVNGTPRPGPSVRYALSQGVFAIGICP